MQRIRNPGDVEHLRGRADARRGLLGNLAVAAAPARLADLRDHAFPVEALRVERGQKIDVTKLHVTFLATPPAAAGLKKMEGVSSGRDAFHCLGRTIYLACPDGYGNSKLTNNAFERALAASATTRNWKTVTTLAAMASNEPVPGRLSP